MIVIYDFLEADQRSDQHIRANIRVLLLKQKYDTVAIRAKFNNILNPDLLLLYNIGMYLMIYFK